MVPFAEWVQNADSGRTGDPLWAVQAYRLSCYAVACHNLYRKSNPRLAKIRSFDQLTRSVGSICANIAEGYSRSTRADRSLFYGYALGSAREAIVWYDSLRIELGDVVELRQGILIQIRRLLLTTLKKLRPASADASLREPGHFEP